jgi:hypothetical protein
MTPHEQDLNEVIAVLNIRLERRHIEATEQSGQIGDLKRDLEQSQAEVERLLKLTATCTCGTPGLDYEGPQPDCMVHGAVRAYSEAQAAIELAREGLKAALDAWTPEHEYNLDRARRKGYSHNEVAAEVYGDAIKAVAEVLAALAIPEASGGES